MQCNVATTEKRQTDRQCRDELNQDTISVLGFFKSLSEKRQTDSVERRAESRYNFSLGFLQITLREETDRQTDSVERRAESRYNFSLRFLQITLSMFLFDDFLQFLLIPIHHCVCNNHTRQLAIS